MAIFTTTAYPLVALIEDIGLGKIGLPDIQRPFVWPNVNVRNLFDSLYRGYPAGYLLFWETGVDLGMRTIGTHTGQAAPTLAIVDGQQRLTSLYAVTKGKEVIRSDFKKERIRIAFNPLHERFDVTDASIVKDKAFIPDISELWKTGTNVFEFANRFIEDLKGIRPLSTDEIGKIQSAIGKLHALPQYSFTALTLNSTVDAEIVAEVFVRINGEGKKLNQADFIMTLMSVFWDEGRAELERFAREATAPSTLGASPYNHFIKPAPDQLLRVGVGLGLKRARLENVYSVLRGRDAVTGAVDPAKRDAQFEILKAAQSRALNLTNWHHFIGALTLAGYRQEGMITSETAIIYAYVLYLVGVIDHGIDKQKMRQAIAEFFFMVSLTGRYTNSPETAFEFDLAQLRAIKSGDDYLNKLRQICATTLTNDYWEIGLPNSLATSASRSPSRSAYQASLILLGARALYSPMKITDMIDPAVKGSKAAVEQHHLFPRGYLAKLGIKETREVNQIANFAVVEWPDNLKISDQSPKDYAPALDAKLSAADRADMQRWHALPPVWWELPYEEFLKERRIRMAKLVREGYQKLCGEAVSPKPVAMPVSELLAAGESGGVEFKSTLRTNLHTGQPDEKIQLSSLKTIAGFLNAHGGTLIVGADDAGKVLGLASDKFENEDKMGLHLVNLLRDRIGDVFLPYVHPHFEEEDGQRVLVIRCERGPKPAFVKDGSVQRFYVRAANSTSELSGNSVTDYVKVRFHS
ncbi:GmrSD restriction endonuclease domain-containing protein [Bradyrhizobium diazoefficiens]|uniref:GmrSD restriction endonuclease domain-containing protein n=1 Tax=Bradyrhizobium diazoefficiens TaxID=1355477 RepID=UPI003834E36C